MKVPSVEEMKSFYKKGKHGQLARWLPHIKEQDDPFIQFLLKSNLTTMGYWASEPIGVPKDSYGVYTISLGADPEFILCDKDMFEHGVTEIVLFSSEWTNDYFGVSEAEVGADYGLLEMRPTPKTTADDLIEEMDGLHQKFGNLYGNPYESNSCKLVILEAEAVEFNHKRKRTLDMIAAQKKTEKEYDANYGGRMVRGYKDTSIWIPGTGSRKNVGNTNQINMAALIDSDIKLSAYGKPSFPKWNDKILSAGGHIHIGGSFIKMLSFEQTQLFVRKLDEQVLPMCNKVETPAGDLRREVYGTLGEFRLKRYGIEWRTPSNAIFWQKNKEHLLKVLEKIVSIATNMALEE